MDRIPQLRYVRNWVSIGGALVTTISAVLFLVIFGLEVFGFHTNPYIGIVVFLILPGFFVGGLVVIPVGMWNERRRQRSGRAPSKPKWPSFDLNDPTTRRVTFAVLVMTFANVVIVSLAAYRGVEYMDSVGFCGQVCHQVMQPEFTAYQDGPHARVACVQCHIGPGAPWFVRSKLSGVRQVFAVLANSYSRPIPSPVQNLRPARDTCEQCHWPAMFHGDKVIVEREFADDEVNTETATTLQLHVGGGGELDVMGVGIHWHVAAANTIEYVASDAKRQEIPWVRLTIAGAPPVVFRSDGLSGDDPPPGELRTMDCVDCHNRPTHPFEPSAERAVDAAMADGQIASSLPYVRREAVRLLKVSYPTREEAFQAIAAELPAFYQNNDGDAPVNETAVAQAVRTVQSLYGRNIFPAMDITWGTYTNNIGHMDSPGCFRCHDDGHQTTDGRVIKQDCETCHSFQ